jgi:peptidoglycan/xylan/chitin deacetylase (PgdA/CDA1 family)
LRTVDRLGRAALGAGIVTGLTYATAFASRSPLFRPFMHRGPGQRRTVALTFDDGPNEPYTSQLLDLLAAHGVQATFFQVGRNAERFPDVTRRVVADGHLLGNHSYSHTFSRYLTSPRQQSEIRRAQDVLTEISGQAPTLYRPPWLCHWPWVLRSIRAAGLTVVSGTFAHPFEILQPSGTAIAARAARITRPGSILIFHDGREAQGGYRGQTVAAIAPLIQELQASGYAFSTVDRILGPTG